MCDNYEIHFYGGSKDGEILLEHRCITSFTNKYEIYRIKGSMRQLSSCRFRIDLYLQKHSEVFA